MEPNYEGAVLGWSEVGLKGRGSASGFIPNAKVDYRFKPNVIVASRGGIGITDLEGNIAMEKGTRSCVGLLTVFLLLFFCSTQAIGQTPGTLKWEFSPGGAVSIGADGTIYVSSGQKLYALNPNGSQKWMFQLPGSIFDYPAIGADGTIYVSTYENLYAVNPDGSQKWAVAGLIGKLAIGANGTIYVSSSGNGNPNLYALNPDGSQKWTFPKGGYPPAIGADGTIYVSQGKELYAVNPDGSQKWTLSMGDYLNYGYIAVGADGTIYLSSAYYLHAVNPDGSKKWTSFYLGYNPKAAIGADGTIYVTTDYVGCWFYALNTDGSKKWMVQMSNLSSPAIGADGTIYAKYSHDGKLYAFNPDGTQKWTFQTSVNYNSPLTIGPDGTVYVRGYSQIYAVYSTSTGLADSGWPIATHDAMNTRRASPQKRVITPLVLEEAHTGLVAPWRFNDYSLEVEAGKSLLIEVGPKSGIDSLNLDATLGQPSSYVGGGGFTTRKAATNGTYALLVSPTEAGTYYVSLFGYDIARGGGSYTIKARYVENYLSDFSPHTAAASGSNTISIKGLGFTAGTQVQLSGSGVPIIAPNEVRASSPTELLARFNLSGATPGTYDLTVFWPNSVQQTLKTSFTITSSGGGPRLETKIDAPEVIRPNRKYTLWLEYKNTGDADLTAPLFTITSNVQISLNENDISATRAQVLGTGTSDFPEILMAGETARIPIYFIAPTSGKANFDLSVSHGTNMAIDWESQKTLMKPPDMSDAEWQSLWPNLISRLGANWSEYIQVLVNDAKRLKDRGFNPFDVGQLIQFEVRQAQRQPVAAIIGTLKDKATGIPVKGVSIWARNGDGSVFRQATTAYAPEGHFVLDNMPDGTYEILADGYAFDPPVMVAVTSLQDVNDLRIYAQKVSSSTDIPGEPIGTPDRNPSLARGASGETYLVFGHGTEVWWSVHDGSQWKTAGQIPGAEGSNPVLSYDSGLLDGGSSPGLFCAWESLTSPLTIFWSVGRITDGEVTWSEPQPLSVDTYDNFSVALVVDQSHRPLLVWLKEDPATLDDTDLYFDLPDLNDPLMIWNDQLFCNIADNKLVDGIPEVNEEHCCNVTFAKGDSIPSWIPIIGGKHELKLKGQLCSSGESCGYERNGGIDAEVSFGKLLSGTGKASVETDWVTDPEVCTYVFDGATMSVSLGASWTVEAPGIPILNGMVPLGEAKISSEFACTLSGSLTWKSNFPSLPDEGQVKLSGEATPKGELKLLNGMVGGSVSGTVSCGSIYTPPSAFSVYAYCVTLTGEMNAGWGFLSTRWKRVWGASCSSERALYYPLTAYSTIDSIYQSRQLLEEDVPVYEQFETFKDAFIGTGSVYPGNPVLSNVSEDFYDDGVPSLAKSAQGEIVLAWTKDLPASELGAKVYVSTFSGATWSAPLAITEVDFNSDATVVFDANDVPMAVWSSASNNGLNYQTSSVEEILAAIDSTDLMFSQRMGATWATPQPVAILPGKDLLPSLSAAPNGELCLAWLNESSEGFKVYASRWYNGSWSEPQMLASSSLMDRPRVSPTNQGFLVLWSQTTGADASSIYDWGIFSASWDGTSWSTATAENFTGELQMSSYSSATNSQYSQARTGEVSTRNCNTEASLIAFANGAPRSCYSPINPARECCNEKDSPPAAPDPPAKELLEEVTSNVIVSMDPNEKAGSMGISDAHFVSAEDRLYYRIYFENKAEATAPAQEVFVTDYLSSSLDWTTVRIEAVAFGDVVLTNPPERILFETRETIPDYRVGTEEDWWVHVSSELDMSTGKLGIVFQTLDPLTGELPEDPYAGFLPPEDGTGRGEGYVSFSVMARGDTSEGTVITNRASIVFDTEAPINTNEVFNTFFDGDGDNDGMEDRWEIDNFADLSRNGTQDYDDDGLKDLDEYLHQTNPKAADSDHDEMKDGWEVQYGLNPLVNDAAVDSDGDGCTNLKEYQLGMNPKAADSDYDGMKDGWEVRYGLNPLVNDAAVDSDGDGYTNLEEYKAGTNPADPNSKPGAGKAMPWLLLLLSE